MARKERRPQTGVSVIAGRDVRTAGGMPPDERRELFRWCMGRADFRADYGGWLGLMQGAPERLIEVFHTLHQFEGSTWAQLRTDRPSDPTLHYYEDPTVIARWAQQRLAEFNTRRVGDPLWAFHITGERVVWGFKDGDTFHVLWWDPEHRVYPTRKRRT